MAVDPPTGPEAILEAYRTPGCANLLVMGSFDRNVTVLRQQIRALNLTYALMELETIWAKPNLRIAIVGTGFAGLTLAAAFLRKGVTSSISLFEQHDTLLPLQQGSDSRWLHPQIYDWPADGSEASAAELPVLNWTAGRASDVVVQVLAEWQRVLEETSKDTTDRLKLYCNTGHLQIEPCPVTPGAVKIEWVGDPRNPATGNSLGAEGRARGESASFDLVIMAVGFGLEAAMTNSYWRNETLGQPSLSQERATYLISGGGDGALIDLLRLRISQFRQDRILDELFARRPELLEALRELRVLYERGEALDLFTQFERLSGKTEAIATEFADLLTALRHRLRRDTEAILKLRQPHFAALLNQEVPRISFQNALLVYLLYRCGGFTPTAETDRDVIKRMSIRREHVVTRHGATKGYPQFEVMLRGDLFEALRKMQPKQAWKAACWPGGYFGQHGPTRIFSAAGDKTRAIWRKEYLPGPTALLGATLAGAAAGVVRRLQPDADHFRLTLHRVTTVQSEMLLQQTCDYLGQGVDVPKPSAAGRTFPADFATIGQAFQTQRIVRSVGGASPEVLSTTMAALGLGLAARKMKTDVGFLLGIPLLQPERDYARPNPVIGVVYVDSRSPGFWLDDAAVASLCQVLQDGLRSLEERCGQLDRIRNLPFGRPSAHLIAPKPLTGEELELVAEVEPPRSRGRFQFNFDHSDITPLA